MDIVMICCHHFLATGRWFFLFAHFGPVWRQTNSFAAINTRVHSRRWTRSECLVAGDARIALQQRAGRTPMMRIASCDQDDERHRWRGLNDIIEAVRACRILTAPSDSIRFVPHEIVIATYFPHRLSTNSSQEHGLVVLRANPVDFFKALVPKMFV